MNANKISTELCRVLRQPYTYVLPNVWVGRFERDVVCINSRSNYWTEYEIKVSKSDFKQDFKKGFTKGASSLSTWNNQTQLWDRTIIKEREFVSKHGQIEAGHKDAPNRFNFVVPEGLIEISEIPDYAGLYYYSEKKSLYLVRMGKFIHKKVVDDRFKLQLMEKSYYRFWNVSHQLESYKRNNHRKHGS